MSELTKQAADMIGNDKATATELQDMLFNIKARRVELESRRKQITSADKSAWGGGPGPERRKVEAAGDVGQVRKFDDEEKDIAAELSVLTPQEKQLRAKLDQSKAWEYIESTPDDYDKLVA